MRSSLEQDGFTLLELVIAMGLFASGLLGFMMLTSGLTAGNMTARHHDAAVQLARNKLEMLREGVYSEIVDSVETEVAVSGGAGREIFTRRVMVEENSDPDFKQVTVTVSWRSKGSHRVTLHSIVAAP